MDFQTRIWGRFTNKENTNLIGIKNVTKTTKTEQSVPLPCSVLQKTCAILLKSDYLAKKVQQSKYLRKSTVSLLFFFADHLSKNLKGPSVKKIHAKKNEFKIIIDPKNGKLDKIIYVFSVWEPELSKIMDKYANKNEIFIDVGANIGYHSLYASNLFKKIIAFEPLPMAYNQFKESVKINNYKNITVHQLACSNKEGKSRIYYYRDSLSHSTIDKPPAKGAHKKPTSLEIKTVTLDSFLKKTKNRIGLIKIDVEGYEPLVMEGLKKIIKKHKPVIITEYHPVQLNNIKKGQALGYLETLDKDYKLIDLQNAEKIEDVKKYMKCKYKQVKEKTSKSDILLIPKK